MAGECAAVVERPVSEIFAFMTDFDRVKEWAPQMGQIVERSGPVSAGMTFAEVRRFLGRRTVARWTVSRFEADRVWGLRLRYGPMTGEFAYHFEPLGPSSTRISEDVAFRLAGPLAVFSGVLRGEAIKEEARELLRLKALLEAR